MFDLDKYVEEKLKDPEFRKAYEEGMEENEAIRAEIAASCARNAVQDALSKQNDRRQSKVNRHKSGVRSPRISILQKIAGTLGMKRGIEFRKKSS